LTCLWIRSLAAKKRRRWDSLFDPDKIPARETWNLVPPRERLLPESPRQSPYLVKAEKGREQELIDIFHKMESQGRRQLGK
jgi:hypothetical protein